MVGFVVVCYQCGVNFIQVLIILLFQVDFLVGGKIGINYLLGKNMIGVFYQFQVVVIDIVLLKMLLFCELFVGLVEVIKYGFICDELFIIWLEEYMDVLLVLELIVVIEVIECFCVVKVCVVGVDECELGVCVMLNFGYIFGYVIEIQQGYGVWLYGEVVGVGIVMVFEMLYWLGWLSVVECDCGICLLCWVGLFVVLLVEMMVEDFMEYMVVDKKVFDGCLCLVLL